jgi:queuine/archaeosine tRNA-ribosyltransferase
MILVSHETPIAYQYSEKDQNRYSTAHWNDYEYALVHLFEQYPNYFDYFKNVVDKGAEVMLDNSMFELKKAFNKERYIQWIDKLNPTCYIVPDVMDDAFSTMDLFESWLDTANTAVQTNSMLMGVVHGKTYQELVDCYKYMVDNADYIAFSYVEKYFELVGWQKWGNTAHVMRQKQASGRQAFISRLIDDGIWNEERPHHLLGCALAREFTYYVEQGVKGIRSIDTADPIMAALQGKTYLLGIGLNDKPQGLLADNVNVEYKDDIARLMFYNTQIFKQLINRKVKI